MSATAFFRTTVAAAVLAGATLTAACAVDDESIDDAVAAEADVTDDGAPVAKAAFSVSLNVFFLHCNGATPWFEANMSGAPSGATYSLYMSTSSTGPWTKIHEGGPFDTWPVTGKRYYYAKGCKSGSCDSSPVQSEARRECAPGDVPL